MILSKFTFDPEFFPWESAPTVSDHWGFHYPAKDIKRFNLEVVGDYLKSTPKTSKVREDFWNFENAYFKKVDFVPVNSSTKIKEIIFGEFIKLSDLDL